MCDEGETILDYDSLETVICFGGVYVSLFEYYSTTLADKQGFTSIEQAQSCQWFLYTAECWEPWLKTVIDSSVDPAAMQFFIAWTDSSTSRIVFLLSWALLFGNWLIFKIPVLNFGREDLLPPIDGADLVNVGQYRNYWHWILSWETKIFYSSFNGDEPIGLDRKPLDSALHISRTFPAWRQQMV